MSHEPGITDPAATPREARDFVRDIVRQDLEAGRVSTIVTRFPPEPNGYLHVGHAKAICLNFGVAREFGGRCHIRMDDTNPTKEEVEYVESITADIKWLVAGWADHCLGLKPVHETPAARPDPPHAVDYFQAAVVGADRAPDGRELEPFFASDYFGPLYEYAEELIRRGHAYVCDLTPEETDRYRGAPDKPGTESPWRGRAIDESLDLFRRMKAGEFPDGARTLRARIDMASPNVWLRDPILYRIRHASHHQTGDAWCLYPMYDYAHCLSDYIEGISHSLCTLEFDAHRALYDWILEKLDLPRPRPRQYEFARLNLTHTLMSKRRLLRLVQEGTVRGWDDPRMPTLSGMRRRGYPAAAIRDFAERIGVAKNESVVDLALLEHCVREELNRHAPRYMAVLKPLKVVIENYPEGQVEEMAAINNPEDPAAGTRMVPFAREIWIEQDDFREVPPPKYHRLSPGVEVRLRYAYLVRCTGVVKDPVTGEVVEVRATYDPATRGGNTPDGRKVKSTIHWVSAAHALAGEARLYDTLFTRPDPDDVAEGEDFRSGLNPASMESLAGIRLEPALGELPAGRTCQFERIGYFCVDPDSRPGAPVFNRTVTLKDSWSRIEKKQGTAG